MKIIGLTGFAGAGKSTVAQYLVEQHGFTRLSFAAPLKKMLRTLDPYLGFDTRYSAKPVRLSKLLAFGMDENQIKASAFGGEYRRLLQVLGTDCIRAVDDSFWVRAALSQITEADDKVVFDDVRFPNEAKVIHNFNDWGLWNVQREGYAAVNGHASEQHAGKMGEAIILDNITLEHLYSQVDDALDSLTYERPCGCGDKEACGDCI